MNTPTQYSAEVREREVRLVREAHPEHDLQWVAFQVIADKIGCTHESLRR